MVDFVTDIFLVTSKSNDFSTVVLDTTTKGHDGNLYESSWRHKGKRLIGYKKVLQDEFIVTDITIVQEDKDVPDDYVGALITNDTKEKGLKKHILCYRRGPRASSAVGVTEIYLVNPSKSEVVPPQFTCADEQVNDIQICFKTEPIPVARPQAPPPIPARQNEQIQQYGNVSPKAISLGIEGVPFQINPKFNTSSNNTDPIIGGMPFISVDDVAQKYQYSFTLEREVVDSS